jgi:hypothetical protein
VIDSKPYKLSARRFNEVLRRVLTDVANELRDRGALDEAECFIDATFVMAKGGGAEIGPTKRGKGMKIMAIVDRHGLPLSISTHAANHHEVRLVQLCFDFYMIEAKPEKNPLCVQANRSHIFRRCLSESFSQNRRRRRRRG